MCGQIIERVGWPPLARAGAQDPSYINVDDEAWTLMLGAGGLLQADGNAHAYAFCGRLPRLPAADGRHDGQLHALVRCGGEPHAYSGQRRLPLRQHLQQPGPAQRQDLPAGQPAAAPRPD